MITLFRHIQSPKVLRVHLPGSRSVRMDLSQVMRLKNIELLEDEEVKNLLVNMNQKNLLNPGKPIVVGPYSVTSHANGSQRKSEIALENAKDAKSQRLQKIQRFLKKLIILKNTKQKDADYIMLLIGSAAEQQTGSG